eukprot:GHVQ01021353.1.p1 GENE.GHVQ01021353.1~~GHVQ01021353.1.p1  ORF type:complete len:244 (+),score=42.51 GHVQ01021353.1:1008-1739(+)
MLYMDNYPSAAELKRIVQTSSTKTPHLEGKVLWGSVVNAETAVLMAQLGGVWLQPDCRHQKMSLPPGFGVRIDLKIFGVQAAEYTADLHFTVYEPRDWHNVDSTGERVADVSQKITIVSGPDIITSPIVVPPVPGPEPPEAKDIEWICDLRALFSGFIQDDSQAIQAWVYICIGVLSFIAIAFLVRGFYTLVGPRKPRLPLLPPTAAQQGGEAQQGEKVQDEVTQDGESEFYTADNDRTSIEG